jgi:pimeloyl-ACP methyl ester carboxylesterase
VCLPGLARTAADLHPLATALTAEPAKPRLVSALDYRGHGQSTYDRNPNNYTIQVALADLSAVLATLEITSAIFVGTSFGGVLAMMLAVLPPIAVAGVILNDIGPVMVKALAKGKRHKAAAHAANRLTRPHRHKPSGDTAICVDYG